MMTNFIQMFYVYDCVTYISLEVNDWHFVCYVARCHSGLILSAHVFEFWVEAFEKVAVKIQEVICGCMRAQER